MAISRVRFGERGDRTRLTDRLAFLLARDNTTPLAPVTGARAWISGI